MESVLRAWIEAEPDLSLSELSARLAKQGVFIKPGALWHQLNKWNLTFKKTLHASEQERDDVQQARCQGRSKSEPVRRSKREPLVT
jgi:transposase